MLIVAISSRALFNLEDGQKIFEEEGCIAFDNYMRENEKKPLRPGVAFPLVKKLLGLNTPGQLRDKVEILLLSSNSLSAGARVMNSVRDHELDIERAFFTSGGDRFRIAKAAKVTLFLSTNPREVRNALTAGIASAQLMPSSKVGEHQAGVRLAFDGDSVLFSDEAELVNQTEGLMAFQASELRQAAIPLAAGPFKPVLEALHELQATFAHEAVCPIRVALVTARGLKAYDRVLQTFRSWNVIVDESYFCGGLPKGPFLEAFAADLFFDDAEHNIESAIQFVPSCHVPNGVLGLQARAGLENTALLNNPKLQSRAITSN